MTVTFFSSILDLCLDESRLATAHPSNQEIRATTSQKRGTFLDPTLRLKPAQPHLTPEQEMEAGRFAADVIHLQLSTDSVDEQAAEHFLREVYAQADLAPPKAIRWVDGPLELVTLLTTQEIGIGVWDSKWDTIWRRNGDRVLAETGRNLWDAVWSSVGGKIRANVGGIVGDKSTDKSVGAVIEASVLASSKISKESRIRDNKKRLRESLFPGVGREITTINTWDLVWSAVTSSMWAYHEAHWLACYAFFDHYLAPNDFHARSHFNELVSGYWLGKELALIVRRPRLLIRDAQGRLHNETGKCLEYHDGWGFYAWHGVRVPERVILNPAALTLEDLHKEEDEEVRRIIQERMA